jgi:aspartyl-tRNA synthetase
MKLLKRTLYCGQISGEYVGKEICLNGWVNRRRDLGGLIFVDLRDRSGIMQLVFDPTFDQSLMKEAGDLRNEYVIGVRGVVINRDPKSVNEKLPTGKFELKIKELIIYNRCAPLPFQLNEADDVSEELRLKYRYLDLRRPKMHDFIKLRHEVIFAIREYFHKLDFYEIETPILSKSTPEGARDYLVPCRTQPGTFYALPQSPQIYKQLLINAGMERYFQIARCFRDEALRANRQPEFAQLDLEMSFVDEKDVFGLCEGLVSLLWKRFLGCELSVPLKHYTYDEVFVRFGSDKPDMRFELEIKDLSSIFKDIQVGFLQTILQNKGKIGAICVKDKKFSRSELDSWVDLALKELGAKGLVWLRFKEDGSCDSSIAKFLPSDFINQLKAVFPDVTKNDTLFISAGDFEEAWTILGQLRLRIAQTLNLIKKDVWKMFWVTDFPMFEWNKEENRWEAKHHPFTSPQVGWEKQEIGDVRARAYDLVCNGEEIGGGSVRIHNPEVQQKVFDIIGITPEKAQEKFGFLLEAQTFGYPPDAGLAFGIERLIMTLARTDSIRDVFAFPKTQKGTCLMMQTPSVVDEKQLEELSIKIVAKK